MSFGNDYVTKYKRDSLRILGTVGEPINPEAWRWYHDVSSPRAKETRQVPSASLLHSDHPCHL